VGVALEKRQVVGHVIAPYVRTRVWMILEQDDEPHAHLLACLPRQTMRPAEMRIEGRDIAMLSCRNAAQELERSALLARYQARRDDHGGGQVTDG
jgi:hypothetical protein